MSYIAVIAGARPNFMKVEPILRVLAERALPAKLIHTGQHYDKNMSDVFFEELQIQKPDVHLGIGSGSHAVQTAHIMIEFEKVCLQDRPCLTLVAGDVNSTVACSLVAAKLGIPVCHLEAGLRSFDWTMPEEINRVVTDRLSDILLTPSRDGDENLLREGVPAERIHFVGNIMIDTLFRLRQKSELSDIHTRLNLSKEYAVATLHRPANVDTQDALSNLVNIFELAGQRLPVVFTLHPRTKAKLHEFKLYDRLDRAVKLVEALGYIDFLALTSKARVVLTDSGGIQEETTALGVPCLTLRENTERPITVSEGTNQIVGSNQSRVLAALNQILEEGLVQKRCPQYWDGQTASRCVDVMQTFLRSRNLI